MFRTPGPMRLTGTLLSMLACAVCSCTWQSAAQTAGSTETRTPPPYTPQVWDIDWSYLRNGKLDTDWTDKFHYIPFGPDSNSYASINGQVRERGEYQDHPGFGAQPPDNGYFLQRYLLSADLHTGDRFRGFAQWDSGLIEARDGGPRPGIDEDRFDINQAFVDVTPWRRNNVDLTARAGRQLVSLGSTRLVAIGAGLNVEQPFDGFRLTLKALGGSAEALALRPTLVKTGVFDNAPNPAEELWGLYLSHSFSLVPRASIDLYYFGSTTGRLTTSLEPAGNSAKLSGCACGLTPQPVTMTSSTPASSAASGPATFGRGEPATTSDVLSQVRGFNCTRRWTAAS